MGFSALVIAAALGWFTPARSSVLSMNPPAFSAHVSSTSAQVPILSGEPTRKRQLLGAVATGELPVTREEFNRLIGAALEDIDESVRVAGLQAVQARVQTQMTSWLTSAPQPKESLLNPGTRDLVVKLLADAAPRVRAQTVRVMTAIDAARSGALPAALSLEFAEVVAGRYSSEPDPTVRVALVHPFQFAVGSANSATKPIGDALVKQALSDPNEDVLQVALSATVRRHSTAALPDVAALLRDRRVSVRVASAEALGAFASEAAPHLAELRDALRSETDTRVRQALAAAIARIELSRVSGRR